MNLASTYDSNLVTNGKNHMVQLDSLRTIAVFAVIASHYLNKYFQYFNWGYAGVFLFFVLSGFLITGILLRARDKDEKKQSSKITSLKRFYIRRTLRIFPLYYAIVIYGILHFPAIRDTWGWHLSYTLNFQMALAGKYLGGITGPFWSLGVEEQFYLIWPFIMFFVPLRFISPLLFVLIVAGPFSRFICVAGGFSDYSVGYLPTSCLDALGLGSLLAFSAHPFGNKHYSKFSFGLGGGVGIVLLSVLLLLPRNNLWAKPLLDIFSPFFLSLFFVWLVSKCAKGFTGITGSILEWKPSVFLGKISYGLYALHILAIGIASKIFHILSIAPQGLIFLCTSLITTICLASLSWFLFEGPINNLKDKLSNSISDDATTAKISDTNAIYNPEA